MSNAVPMPPGRLAAQWTRRIRLRHLEVLLAIARHGSLTAAANALGITQPAVSQWLADIETAAGVRLFERGQRLRPTPSAAPVLAHAERVMQDAQRTLAEVASIRSGGTGRVRVGTMSVAAVELVPATVLRLRAGSPGIELTLVEDIAAVLWDRFERNELDVLATRLDARALGSGLPHRRLFADRHRVVCGPAHPLAARRRVTWRDVARYPWLMPTGGTPLHEALIASFASAGVPPPPTVLTSVSVYANLALLRETDALGVQSGAVAARMQAHGLLVALPLALTHDIGDVGLVWRDPVPGAVLQAVLGAFTAAGRALDST
ncbi:MAG: LysR substrate-binding domain-containing protein [Burkholderiales bacterium]|jgi:DNA-binding transcriptional LysR family regulator|nr:LysR substrate-binding domain-containing protein [Burkholderiales bacterium]